ncbi:MAG: ankyrin repeat domain-containing protein [Actinomycetota bacterium]
MTTRALAALPISLAVPLLLTLGACSPQASDPSPSPTPTAVGAATISKEQWLAALDPDDGARVAALLTEPGVATVVDVRDAEGMSALLYAAQRGDAELVGALLDAGADPTQREMSGFPVKGAIHIAAAAGDIATLTVLLDHGLDVNTLDGASGHALLWAAYKGQADAVTLLLAKGSDTTLVDGSGMNASERAAGEGFTEIAAQIAAAMPAE